MATIKSSIKGIVKLQAKQKIVDIIKPTNRSRCDKCNGKIIIDNHKDIICLMCGKRFYTSEQISYTGSNLLIR